VHQLRITLIVGLAAALASALAAGSAGAAQPVVNDHYRFTSDPYSETWCGQVPGTAVDTVVEHFMQDASGNYIDNVHVTTVFTASATGKSILSSASNTTQTSGPIDNGNGTVSFISRITGLVLKFQIPNGPILRAADGEPIRSAGDLIVEDVFDAATGDYITTNESFTGPHLGREGVDFCGSSVDYLLDP
jgi:hypothetical protein